MPSPQEPEQIDSEWNREMGYSNQLSPSQALLASRLPPRGGPQVFYVHEVSGATGRELVADQDFERDISNWDVIGRHPRFTRLPGGIEVNGIDSLKDVDATEGNADLEPVLAILKIRGGHSSQRRPEVGQGAEDRGSVLRGWIDKYIQVFCRPRLCIEGIGVAADHQISNLVGVEREQ